MGTVVRRRKPRKAAHIKAGSTQKTSDQGPGTQARTYHQ